MRGHRIAAGVAMTLASAWLTLDVATLTDGDSCLYGAMSREIAKEGNWAAPTWAKDGEQQFFRENPPGALWLAAFLQAFATGLDDYAAPLLANLWWLGLLTAAVWRLAGGRRGAGGLAVLALLFMLPVAKYSLRAGLEIPFAACVCAALASLRTRRRRGALLAGLFFGGALLTRGVFAGMVPLLWWMDARVGHRRPLRRALAAGVLGLTLAFAFDLAHRAQGDGASFWWSYFQQQVWPSLPGAAPHPISGSTWLYYATRLGLYSLPWGLLILWRLPSRLTRMRPEVPLCLGWLALVYVGASLGQREGSRYLFVVWPAVAILFSALWREDWEALSQRWRTRLSVAAILWIPVGLMAGTMLARAQQDPWDIAARRLQERASYGWEQEEAPIIRRDSFFPGDDRLKQFLRWHLGTWALWAPESSPPIPEWELIPWELAES